MADATKAMTLRLDRQRAAEFEAVARADGVSISDALRGAVEAHIESRRQDPQFKERLRALLESDREVLERLAS